MKRFAIGFFASIFATATWATDFVWTGNTQHAEDWFDPDNWEVNGSPADTYPQSGDTATFNKAATLNVNSEITVGTLILNANLTHRRDKWLTVGAIEGDGEIILMNRGRLRNISGTAVECNNDIRIVSPDGTDWDNRTAMPWIQGNGANFDIKGRLLGDGHVFFTMAGYSGVRLYGDNSGFTGTIHVDSNSSNRMKFGAAQAGFENGRLIIYGDVNDNGSMLFENGTIHFGSIYTPSYTGGAKFRCINNHNTLIIGALNRNDDRITLGMGDDANAYARIVKVGTGTLELGPTRHREGTIISNGIVKVTHPDGICHKDSRLTFAGGTLLYGLNPADGNNPVTKDVSAYVKDSTEFISVDTDGHDITWSNSAMYNNNPDAKGVVKKGEGTLELSGSNRDGTWKFFGEATKTNRIDGGTLVIRNAKYNSRYTLTSKILGSGTLKIASEEANGGIWLHGTDAFAEFTGTLDWANELSESSYASGLRMADHINFEMPLAKLRVSGNPAEPTAIMKVETQYNPVSAHVTVDSFEHLHANAQIYSERSAWTLNLLGVSGDSYLNGAFTGQAVNIVKAGARKLTMGSDFTALEGSTITVNEGVFALDAGVTYAQYASILTIASGVAFAGEGVFGAVNLSVNDVVVPDVATFTDKTATYPILTATSFSGTSANVTALLNTLNANEKSGSWRVRAVPTGNGAYTLTIVYAKSGFMIIFK